MEILKKHRCVEYGIDHRGMLYLCEYGGGFSMVDTPENREYMENEFGNWKNVTHDSNCEQCPYKDDCHEW